MSVRALRGFTLIEMTIAIVIIGVGITGVMLAFNTAARSSADPMVRKQALAVAEEMMEEIRLRPFTVTGAAPAHGAPAICGDATAPRAAYDDVFDYNGYVTTGICDIDGVAVGGLGAYNLGVVVAAPTAADLGAAVPLADIARIAVTVTAPNGEVQTLIGWRTDY